MVENEAPYEILSENMYLDRNQKIIGFSGKVILNQGPLMMSADQIELFFSETLTREGFQEMKALGNVRLENSNSISATGNIASYSVNGREMILTGNVLLTNEMSMIKGNKLILNIDTGKIEIFNDELNQERVKGILVEENKKIDN